MKLLYSLLFLMISAGSYACECEDYSRNIPTFEIEILEKLDTYIVGTSPSGSNYTITTWRARSPYGRIIVQSGGATSCRKDSVMIGDVLLYQSYIMSPETNYIMAYACTKTRRGDEEFFY